ncbi:MAG: nitroreductase [Phenylobacterium sp.]|uniref:nitroreductase family protein n=1 Tax=Phenylobacterium sp. TaxID=1871053 RepID=UPI00355EBAB0
MWANNGLHTTPSRPPVPLPLPEPPAFGEPVPQTPSPEVLHFLARRRSASAVNLTEPAPSPAELDALLRIAVRVPDHGKLSPWRFVVLSGEGKAEAAARLEALASGRGDARAVAKLAKLKTPPMAVAVVSRAKPGLDIPEWEQQLSAGAVCTLLLVGAQAMGYGANWITDWYSYDAEARTILGLEPDERIAGMIMLGTAKEPPLERERADPAALTSVWRP